MSALGQLPKLERLALFVGAPAPTAPRKRDVAESKDRRRLEAFSPARCEVRILFATMAPNRMPIAMAARPTRDHDPRPLMRLKVQFRDE